MKPNVSEAAQSPMNARRWKCVLACGHTQWHTANKRPKHVHCVACGIEKGRNAPRKPGSP